MNLSIRYEYSFFVRGWYDGMTYSVFRSDGVMVDTAPPKTTDKQALTVIEVRGDHGLKDVDFQKETDTMRISWTNKFLPGAVGILKYRVYISTSPGGHNIHASDDLTTTTYTARNLSLQAATVYFSSVVAYSRAGLVSWAYSDGVRVDVLPPVAGTVSDGQEMHDTDYQSSPSAVSASWHGFSDTDSTIITYFWCVGRHNDTTDCSVLGWRETGLHTTFKAQLASPLQSGTRLWSKVYAVDAVGHASDVAVSDGVVVDTSPPEPQAVAYLGDNLVKNPSFEIQNKPVNSSTCNDRVPEYWQTDNYSCIHIITSERQLARHGSSYVVVSGSVLQADIHLSVAQMYKVKIHAGYTEVTDTHHSAIEGFVSVGAEVITFSLEPNLCRGVCDVGRHSVIMWNTHTLSFIAREESAQLTIGTKSRSMVMAVDHVTLQSITYSGHDGTVDTEKHVEVNAVFLPDWSSLHVSWHFTDSESPITMYQWAVGESPITMFQWAVGESPITMFQWAVGESPITMYQWAVGESPITMYQWVVGESPITMFQWAGGESPITMSQWAVGESPITMYQWVVGESPITMFQWAVGESPITMSQWAVGESPITMSQWAVGESPITMSQWVVGESPITMSQWAVGESPITMYQWAVVGSR
ncbi:uncharacterized threonine-rich GPI-anchored glycoprotein PJ4664.02-like [Haliotis rubra]|uniref:uncharacterized threonine-rich GPI-anchored glycoprotein PJ4664.02-like n=1 Tax=Haliotis rubra TaxID=36100 RepID=UPI001EE5183B|nr:uncharacterized threonine-rich GPI-anchored glycoprotein PJ4664.02-like [Haliotis rubra]